VDGHGFFALPAGRAGSACSRPYAWTEFRAPLDGAVDPDRDRKGPGSARGNTQIRPASAEAETRSEHALRGRAGDPVRRRGNRSPSPETTWPLSSTSAFLALPGSGPSAVTQRYALWCADMVAAHAEHALRVTLPGPGAGLVPVRPRNEAVCTFALAMLHRERERLGLSLLRAGPRAYAARGARDRVRQLQRHQLTPCTTCTPGLGPASSRTQGCWLQRQRRGPGTPPVRPRRSVTIQAGRGPGPLGGWTARWSSGCGDTPPRTEITDSATLSNSPRRGHPHLEDVVLVAGHRMARLRSPGRFANRSGTLVRGPPGPTASRRTNAVRAGRRPGR